MLPRAPDSMTLDLYHVDSAYVAWRAHLNAPATFDLYARSHPFGGAYMLVAGLEPALEFVRGFRFGDDEISYVRSLKPYDEAFLEHLRELRFTGEILAMPEGSIAFADEPLMRVTAPFAEALLLESGLLHAVSVSTLIATKAARVVHAAHGRPVAEFGLRRAQNPMLATRAASIGGCASTSFLGAARAFDLAASGTIPHALIQAFADEQDAFAAVADTLDRYTLLLDTYDVGAAIGHAIKAAKRADADHGHTLVAVRLDSGDLAADARHVRARMDAAGMHDVKIFASGDLDEYSIEQLLQDAAPIDAFGVGTSIGVGAGAGSVSAVYKLVWYEGAPDPAAIKRAGDKSTRPGRKQVWRVGDFERDVIQLDDERPPARAEALLQPLVVDGHQAAETPKLQEVRERAHAELARLPDEFHGLIDPPEYPVEHSRRLRGLRDAALEARGLK